MTGLKFLFHYFKNLSLGLLLTLSCCCCFYFFSLSPQTALINPQSLAPFFTPEVLYWEDQILIWSNQYNLDPNLVATIIQVESCGDPEAVSSAGALGLFQVMPYHFQDNENPYFPDTNAHRGLSYFNQILATYSDINLAFAAYNAGIQGVNKPYELWPQETQRYFYWTSGIYKDTLSLSSNSPRLQEWLEKGGNDLCKQAYQKLIFK